MTSRCGWLIISLLLLTGQPVIGASASDRVALVIGNYRYSALNDLKNPGRDAEAMAQRLQALNFQLLDQWGKPTKKPVLNLNEAHFTKAIRYFAKQAKGKKMALVYYAGHGMQFGATSYLLPIDVPSDDLELAQKNSISLDALLKRLDGKAELTIAVFDACREIPELAEAVDEIVRDSGYGKNDFRGLAKVRSEGQNRIVAYSGAAGQLVADGQEQHSPYTALLLTELEKPGLEVGDLFRQVAHLFGEKHHRQKPEVLIQGVPPQHYFFRPKEYPADPVPKPPASGEQAAWAQVEATTKPAVLKAFLALYPNGVYRQAAQLRLLTLVEDETPAVEVATQPAGAKIRVLNIKAKKEPQHGDRWLEPITQMAFVYIRSGCFQMGSPKQEKGRNFNEGPVHQVCVDGFWLAEHEVTNRQYRRYRAGHDSKDYQGHSLNGDQQPVVHVSHHEATGFATWLSNRSGQRFRLPTEAEWEYAARGGTTSARFWGASADSACQYGNVHDQASKRKNGFAWTHHRCDDGYAVVAPVGRFKTNPFGLHDMLGNVGEWVRDWYGKDYYGQSLRQNPEGPLTGTNRVIRGGGWHHAPTIVRSAKRGRNAPSILDDFVGFRLLRRNP